MLAAMRSRRSRVAAPSLALAVLLPLAACNTVGPRAVRTARASYNEAVVRTWNEQLLLNLVRLRYRDTPYFLEVSSVSTHYSLGASALVSGRAGTGQTAVDAEVEGGYNESPTITYTPLGGKDFVRPLLAPITLETLFLLPQSGWSIERVLRCCVQRINDLPNAPSAAGPTPDYVPTYEEFARAASLFRSLQVAGDLQLGVRHWNGEEDDEQAGYVLRFVENDGDSGEVAELRRLLAEPPVAEGGRRELDFTLGALDRRPGELAVYPRSLMGVMFFLSQAVEPPPEHRSRGWVTVTRDAAGEAFDWRRVTGDLLRIPWSESRPADAFVAVPYRGVWFYIDDADLESKSTFGLLVQLFSLQAGEVRGLAPMLTLPVGG